MADIDFRAYMAQRREAAGRTVDVQLSDDLTLHFSGSCPAVVILDRAADEYDDIRATDEFLRACLPADELETLRELIADPANGLDFGAVSKLVTDVMEQQTARPTEPSSTSPKSRPGRGRGSNASTARR